MSRTHILLPLPKLYSLHYWREWKKKKGGSAPCLLAEEAHSKTNDYFQ